MSADATTQYVVILWALARDFDAQPQLVKTDRRALARTIRQAFVEVDVTDDDLDCYEELVTLGLAERCWICGRGKTTWSEPQHGLSRCGTPRVTN